MALAIDSYVAGDRVEMDITRGERWRLRFECYQDAGGGGCSPSVAGDPLDLSSYTGLLGTGRVNGTDASLLVTAELIDAGAANRPAIVSVAVEAVDIELCFADGAEQAFDVTVLATAPGLRDLLLSAHVEVADSAFGANR